MAQSWDTEANDVFLCSHQKVGTHLAKKFLVELARELLDLPTDHPYSSGDIGHDTFPWPEVLYSQHGRGRWQQHLGLIVSWYQTAMQIQDEQGQLKALQTRAKIIGSYVGSEEQQRA